MASSLYCRADKESSYRRLTLFPEKEKKTEPDAIDEQYGA